MLQVDLPMPESCDVCPFNYDFCCCKAINDEEWEKVEDDWNWNVCNREDRPEYCPLKEIVRCKDCKYQYCDLKDGRIVCGKTDNGEIHLLDWFCADGEMKE